jgi:hypothetical protein
MNSMLAIIYIYVVGVHDDERERGLNLLGAGCCCFVIARKWEGSNHPVAILDLVTASRCCFPRVTARSGKVACFICEETANARNSM